MGTRKFSLEVLSGKIVEIVVVFVGCRNHKENIVLRSVMHASS